MSDVIELIEQDHREVEGLFAQYESTPDVSIATKICDELDRHADGEEKAFYPVVKEEVPDGKKLIDEGVKEHKEARQLIGRIRRTENDEHVAELVQELKKAIEHHVKEEESEMLPKTREALGDARLAEIAPDFEAAKERAST